MEIKTDGDVVIGKVQKPELKKLQQARAVLRQCALIDDGAKAPLAMLHNYVETFDDSCERVVIAGDEAKERIHLVLGGDEGDNDAEIPGTEKPEGMADDAPGRKESLG